MIIPFNCDTVRLTSAYGWRNLNGGQDNHKGYDLVGVGSTEVIAAVGGVVAQSQRVTDTNNLTWQWGNYICIKTADGHYHYYCHLASRAVKKGDKVKAGDIIGIMGATGYTFGAHLHFEVRASDGKTELSPEKILGIPNKEGEYCKTPDTDKDLSVLVERGVINSPNYWKVKAEEVEYFAQFVHNVKEYIK